MSDRLYTVETGSSAQVVAKLLRVLFPDAATVLDATYSQGKFWTQATGHIRVIGTDLDQKGAKDARADFRHLPFRSGSVDVVVLDPPYICDPGRGKPGVMSSRFGAYASVEEMRAAVKAGCREAWRVARLGAIVKTQDHVHNSRKVWMSGWVAGAMPVEEYERVHLVTRQKVIASSWTQGQLSAWSNATTWQVFRTDGPVHKRRRPALEVAS